MQHFISMCPMLIYQLDIHSCRSEGHFHGDGHQSKLDGDHSEHTINDTAHEHSTWHTPSLQGSNI